VALPFVPLIDRVPAKWPQGAPAPTRVAIVGDCPDEAGEISRTPFAGHPGYLLRKQLAAQGLDLDECLVTNVFSYRPTKGEIKRFFIKKMEWNRLKKAGDLESSTYPAFGTNGFVHPKLEPELQRLKEELGEAKPHLVIALGAAALWALTGQDKITVHRGSTTLSTLVPGLKVLPTYHPAGINSQWELLPTFVADLGKAQKEAEFPEIRRQSRIILIEPTLREVEEFFQEHILPAPLVCLDIETKRRQIDCISLGPNENLTMVIPLWDTRKPGWSYWTREEELEIWRMLKWALMLPNAKLGQNVAYDLSYLLAYGIPTGGVCQDTMLMSHSMDPEGPKSLGHMGSIYCSETAWKALAHFKSEKALESET